MNRGSVINLDELKNGYVGVTPVLAQVHLEAIIVCLYSQSHRSPIDLTVNHEGMDAEGYSIYWTDIISDQLLRA